MKPNPPPCGPGKSTAEAGIAATAAAARIQPTLERLDAQEQLGKSLKKIDEMQASHYQAIAVRESGCQRAFGAGVFCTCLMKRLPVAFPDYIFVTTRSKEENEYADMPPDMKQADDMVAPIRNRCVNQAAR